MLSLRCKGRLLVLDEPKVMGIINVTDDSFYAGSRVSHADAVLRKAETMLRDGAAILDIGGQSTRPGSERIPDDEELKRTIPAIESIAKHFPEAILSVDTFYSRLAREAVHAGASIVNDVSAGSLDTDLWTTVAALDVPYVLMHMQGEPQTMQQSPHYQNVVLEAFDFLNTKRKALQRAGVNDIIIDPGFGFGKTARHNFQILSQLSFFNQMDLPVMAGLSRKATVYKTLGITPEEALNGTTVLHTLALLNGATILRVHDVKEAVQAITLVNAFRENAAT